MKFKNFFLSTIILFSLLCFNRLFAGDTILWQKNLAARTFEFHPNNNYLAVDYGLGITLRDVLTGEEIRKVIDVKKDGALAMNFSKDGKYLACGSGSGRIWVWDTETWEERVVDEIPGGLTNITGILSIQFSPDGKFLAAAASNYGMVIYETTTWKRIDKWNGFPSIGGGLLASATNVSFRFDSKALAITSNQANKVFLYDINAKQPYDSLYGASAQFSPVRNELSLIKIIHQGSIQYSDGLDIYTTFTKNKPDIHIDPSTAPWEGKLEFNYSSDGGYIIIAGSGMDYDIELFNISSKNMIKYYNIGIANNPRISQNNKYLSVNGSYVYMFDLGTLLGVTENAHIKDFNIFPNPTNDNISISYNLQISSLVELKLSNLDGSINKLIKSEFQTEQQNTEIYSTSDLPVGTYFITLKINDKIYSQKLNIVR